MSDTSEVIADRQTHTHTHTRAQRHHKNLRQKIQNILTSAPPI